VAGHSAKNFFFKSSFERARQKTKKKETFAECQVAGHSAKTKKILNEPRAGGRENVCRVPRPLFAECQLGTDFFFIFASKFFFSFTWHHDEHIQILHFFKTF